MTYTIEIDPETDLTPEENKMITANAALAGMTVPEFLKKIWLGDKPVPADQAA